MHNINKSIEIANALSEINEYLKLQDKLDKYNKLLRAYKTNDLNSDQVNYLREKDITSNIEKRLQLTINSLKSKCSSTNKYIEQLHPNARKVLIISARSGMRGLAIDLNMNYQSASDVRDKAILEFLNMRSNQDDIFKLNDCFEWDNLEIR